MDAEMLKLKAHIDQLRSEMRQALTEMASDDFARLVKTCAAAGFRHLDGRAQSLVGLLAIVAAFDLIEKKEES